MRRIGCCATVVTLAIALCPAAPAGDAAATDARIDALLLPADTDTQTELVIMVTPYITRPPQQTRLPDMGRFDGLAVPPSPAGPTPPTDAVPDYGR